MTPSTDPKPREWFEEWREPSEFYRAADKGLGSLYNDHDKRFDLDQYLCDAYHAGMSAPIWRDNLGPCEVRLVKRSAEFPDAQVKPAGHPQIELEITMALDWDSRLCRDLGERRAAKLLKPVTGEELRASAREAIPRVVEKKANQYRSGGEDISLLIITNGSLSAEEMAQLTEPWKNCFHAICLLRLLDVVMAWPELRVLSGEEPC